MTPELDALLRILGVVSPVAAVIALVFGRGDRHRDNATANVQRLQRISDNVDNIRDDVRETKGDVKDMNRMMADHSKRIELMEERQRAMGERIGRLEKRCDMRSAGGTD